MTYDQWKTTEPDWSPYHEDQREQRTPRHPGWPASEETRLVWCDCCEGAGQIEEYPPHPTPQGPRSRVYRCEACDGRGWEEIPVETLTEDDLEEAFGS